MGSTIRMRPKSPKSPAGSVAAICNNDDLLMEIILLLPPKSLMRFQSVNKHWQSLTSSPDFSRLHLQCHLHKPQHSYFILYARRDSFYYFNPVSKLFLPYHLNFNSPGTIVLQSSHGLLLVRCGGISYDVGPIDYFVYNPTTRQSKILFVDDDDVRRSTCELTLAFDPSRSPYYKVVCVWRTRSILKKPDCRGRRRTSVYHVDVYDSESHTWKVLVEALELKHMLDFASGIYWEDRIYWTTHDVYLDMEEGSIGRITAPIWKLYDDNFIQSNGSVRCVGCRAGKTLVIDELLAGDDGCPRWVEKYKVDDLKLTHPIVVLGITMMGGEHQEEELSLVFHGPGKFGFYKLSNGSSGILTDLTTHDGFQGDKFYFLSRLVYQVTESLTPI